MIFCKIYDERRREKCRKNNETYRRKFWVGVKERNSPEGQAEIAKRIKNLFNEVKNEDYKDVFSPNDTISLNDKVLSYVAGELSRYSFLEASVDAKGMAYESIVSNTLKQERGQFFTPRNVIRLMVEMMDPGENHRILDPACGSGGFLVAVLDHVRKKVAKELFPNEKGVLLQDRANSDPEVLERSRRFAEKNIFGIDFDVDLTKASRMNMVMSGDGHGNIFNLNSLEYPEGGYTDIQLAIEAGVKFHGGSEAGSFDFVFTNPPFGSKIPIDDQNILENFDMGYKWIKNKETGKWEKSGKLYKSQPPEILFIERCWQFLKKGGKMAIVLPDGILGNPDMQYVRHWILENCKVLASIDLPVEAFLPQVGVQASLLFLQRKTHAELLLGPQLEYDVFMAIAEKVGKDRRGNPLYIRDEDGAELSFKKSIEELHKTKEGQRIVREITVFEKKLDDDLPRIAEQWKLFLQGG